jgi:hypothetical protein
LRSNQVATLLLTSSESLATSSERATDCPSLRAWLGKDWAILFSHPGDFVRCDLEMDRWLAVVQRAFTGCRIRPLALASAAPDDQGGWVAKVSGDFRTVLLEVASRANVRAFDLRAHALHHDIRALGAQRFVMIIDEALRSRRTFIYHGLVDVPSPLEFLGWADAVRARHESGEAMKKQSTASVHAQHISPTRRHKHAPAEPPCHHAPHAGAP